MRTRLKLLALCTAVALSGCEAEVGASLDEGHFGTPTLNNTLTMSGDRTLAIEMTRRFAAEVPSMITFAFDSAALDDMARAALAQQAAWLQQYPYARIRVYGHTDKVGTPAYNKRLGLRRAQAAVDFLVSRGIARNRLEAVVSYGDTQPLIVTEGRERRNRRTVTEVAGFVAPHRMIHDGTYMHSAYRNRYIGRVQKQGDE
ncbi:Outer membrane lipoprotein precursor, OmpA family [Rhodovulum sp. P5]|uniref:OmpA family protein n=1 Tax=Rhodovulum sp. P5 TaxID=1564506 RepID=UPI0009C309AE|nr:OmpA family protein [Rhodovulum sp. P5]ARE41387.1 Outer membrane lipoprotein precursor, OmpA family [Rhodovulum sp. P5]